MYGFWLRAAGVGGSVHPRLQSGASGRHFDFTARASAVTISVCRVLCILALASLVVAPLGLFASLFIYDSPHAGGIITGVSALSLWTFPVTASIGGIKGLRSCKAHNVRMAVIWTMLAWVSQIVFCIALVLSQVLCNGSSECY